MKKASKIMTLTDVGKNNSHLSAIRIPMNLIDKGILPALTTEILNPKKDLSFFDQDNNKWVFTLIYYNDKYFGKPTKLAHSEYRLSNVREFTQAYNLDAGDEISFSVDDEGVRRIEFRRKEIIKNDNDDGIIHIRGGWKIYDF